MYIYFSKHVQDAKNGPREAMKRNRARMSVWYEK